MAYDPEFYEKYSKYLIEKKVRNSHDKILKMVKPLGDFDNVVDFGCGQFNEFLIYGKPQKYLGIDKEVENFQDGAASFIKADYRNSKNLQELINPLKPTSFVSLFSSEIIDHYKENYEFYERAFSEIPSLNKGLVSGFFYESKKRENPIGEAGGIMSYQTLEDIDNVHSKLFNEMRFILPVPSKMFGKDVFEVWKLFERK